MGWLREETVLVQCYPIENLTWETGGDWPYIGLFWDLPSETSTGDLIALQVYRDDELIATLPADYTSFSDDSFGDAYETHLYSINAVYSDGCEAMSETVEAMWIPDGVDELWGQSCIYPNPAKDMLRIEGKDILQVEVFNIVGQKVLSISENFDAIQLNSLPDGMYFVRLQTKQGKKTAKLMIEK